MAYKIKSKRNKKGYFKERELKEIRKRYKGDVPVGQIIKEGHRFVADFPKATHTVNHIVIYKKKEYVVKKVSRKGVHLSPLKKTREGYLDEGIKLGKTKFVPEKKYSGNAVPVGQFIVFGVA
jgi:hypothetical protein